MRLSTRSNELTFRKEGYCDFSTIGKSGYDNFKWGLFSGFQILRQSATYIDRQA
jgi:hypothetical protein